MSTPTFTDPPALPLWPGQPPYAFNHPAPEEVTDRPPRPEMPGPNRAVNHVKVGDKWEPRFQRDPDPQSPAAGVVVLA